MKTRFQDMAAQLLGIRPADIPLPSPEKLFWSYVAGLPVERRLEIAREIMAGALPPADYIHIPSLKKRTTPVMNTWRMQNEVMEWDFQPGARVLDVGSGGWPFTHATHLADMFPEETSHRRERLVRDQRPFYVVDIRSMPFKDREFDFTFCSHVLEHLDDPGAAIRELQRVSPRGYVEVPTRLSDVMFNFTGLKDHHRWHGLNLNGTLALIEWPLDEKTPTGTTQFFSLAQSEYENPFQDFLEANWKFFFTGIRWEGSLPFIVISNTGEVLDRSE